MPTLTIIGCGKVGKTLGALWARQGVFQMQQLFNRTEENAHLSAQFVGQGIPVWEWDALVPSDIFLIAPPDRHIPEVRRQLALRGLLSGETILFHCSGVLSSSVLQEQEALSSRLASVHPVKSFANVDGAVASFTGTYCGMEGDPEALHVLQPAFEAIGGLCFTLDPAKKTLYHAASVLVCNYVTALLEVGIQTYAEAGIPRSTSMNVMKPMVRETIENVFQLGTVRALTGPIARADQDVVLRQRDALYAWNADAGHIYTLLGRVAVDLAKQQGTADPAALDALQQALAQEASEGRG